MIYVIFLHKCVTKKKNGYPIFVKFYLINLIIKNTPVENSPFEKPEVFAMADSIEYVDHAIVTRTIVHKITGNVSIMAYDKGETVIGKLSPFGTLIQVIEGIAEILIDGISNQLKTGQSILIPAHSRNTIKANVRFKMLSTVIKSGYEEVA